MFKDVLALLLIISLSSFFEMQKRLSLINQGEFIPSAWVNRSCIFNRPFECVVECGFDSLVVFA
jgi:hypothetical protein